MNNINGRNNFFEEISNERALQSPFGKNSLLYTELKGDFYEGYVPIIPILWKLGAPMPSKEENIGKGTNLQEIIIKAEQKIEQKIFDYAKYSEQNQEVQKYWEYQENKYVGQAILNKKVGYIDPEKIFYEQDGIFYNLYVPYKDDSKVSLNNSNIEYLKENAIIKLKQLDSDAFIIILSNLSNSKRKIYVNNILKEIFKGIENLLQNPKNIQALLDIPIDLLRKFKYETLQNIFNEFLKSETTIPWFRETILINILKVLPEKEGFDATTFLNSLVKPTKNGGNYFYKLYDKMNDWGGENNFSQLIIELTKIWSQSIYSNPFLDMFDKYEAPATIMYHQNYILGFRNDNFDFEFKGNNALIIQEKVIRDGENIGKKQICHIFQPVEVKDLAEDKAENLKLSEGVKLPAFYLKAFDDKSAWENFEKAVWLTADIVSTVSGIGNLAKLRYLVRTEKTAYVVLKTTFGVVEVATGTISIGLSLIENNKNKEWVNKIREYLFWAEICTLGADVLSSKILSEKAQEAQETLDVYRKTVKNEKELKQIDEFGEHLDDVIQTSKKLSPKLIIGKYSKRTFDINNCGGEILNLSWENTKITKEGIDVVKKHLSRLEYDDWNIRMIDRLEKVEKGQIPITEFDKRFYTHEIREFERYKKLGYENTNHKNIPDEVWDNAHAATLEDYKLHEKMKFENNEIYSLFHPDVQH